uniref:Family with sequence similarity 167 member A n=1 Tax=Myripristis murdjan TaxID=586833 RepID=A0A667XD01_9TELE
MSVPQIRVDRASDLEEADKEDMELATDDHLMTLKALAEKLRLQTRRPSYLEWKAQLETESLSDSGIREDRLQMEHEGKPVTGKETVVNSDVIQCKLPSDVLKGFRNIDEALNWLRKELVRNWSHSLKYIFVISLVNGRLFVKTLNALKCFSPS